MSRIVGSLYGEYLKTRRSAVPYIIVSGAIFIGALVFIAHYLDIHNVVTIGRNPWERILHATFGFFSYFLVGPLMVLIISLQANTELRASGWKMLYTLPVRRSTHYFSKLYILLCVYVVLLALLTFFTIFSAILLGFIFPELEVFYYAFPLPMFLKFIIQAVVAGLGVLGFHYFISLRFSNVFFALGIGIFGYIVGFILVAANVKVALYNPYDLPMINDDFDMMRYTHIEQVLGGFMTNAQLCSLVIFAVFVIGGYLLERKRQVK